MNSKAKISVVLIVFNSEETVRSCLESVTWADEIIVVDNGSTDDTLAIVKKFTKHIYHHKNPGFVEPTRNFAISKATGDWIFILDADERVPFILAERLRRLTTEETAPSCVKIPRKNIIFNQWLQHTGWWPDYHIRFFKRGSVVWSDEIHSKPEITGTVMELPAEEEYALHHLNYTSVSQFLQKLDRYTTITVDQMTEKGYTFTWKSLFTSPFEEFLSRYFARKGYKDGLHGLVLSILMAFYELVIVLKLWEKHEFTKVGEKEVTQEFEQAVKSNHKHMRYWLFQKHLGEEKNVFKQFSLKLKNKLP